MKFYLNWNVRQPNSFNITHNCDDLRHDKAKEEDNLLIFFMVQSEQLNLKIFFQRCFKVCIREINLKLAMWANKKCCFI